MKNLYDIFYRAINKKYNVKKYTVKPSIGYNKIGACDCGVLYYDYGYGYYAVYKLCSVIYDKNKNKTIIKNVDLFDEIIEDAYDNSKIDEIRTKDEILELKKLSEECDLLLYDGSLSRLYELYPDLYNIVKDIPIVGVVKDSKKNHYGFDIHVPDHIIANKILNKYEYIAPIKHKDLKITFYKANHTTIKIEMPSNLDHEKIISTLMYLSDHSTISYPLPLHVCDMISKFSRNEAKLFRKIIHAIMLIAKKRIFK